MLNEDQFYLIACAVITATAAALKIFENNFSKRKFAVLASLIFALEIIVLLKHQGFINYTFKYGLHIGSIWSIVFIAISLLYIALATMISIPALFNFEIRNICPSLFFLSYVDRFASNGRSDYRFMKLDCSDCIKICLRNFHQSVENNEYFTTFGDCGIIFEKNLNYPYFSKGFKICDKKFMEIEIKGARGGEKVGLAIKNTDGEEMKVGFDRLLQEGITNTWNMVKVDLPKNFQNVVISHGRDKYMKNFSIFSNTNMFNEPEEQIVFIRRISFQPPK
jgi:hypothetical protein